MIRIGIVGTGNLGRRHAAMAAGLAGVKQVCVYDVDAAVARQVAGEAGATACESLDDLLAQVDAVSVVTPTVTHCEIALAALAAGKHVFVEKPISSTPDQARQMIAAAQQAGCILQVGHVERFNPAVMEAEQILSSPQFIEVHRLGPLAPQVRDVGVVLDLMIHDLDLILWLVGSKVAHVDAVGVNVITPYEDIANARLRFANGCIANVTASRVTPEPQRKIRFFQPDAYLSLDYMTRTLDIYRRNAAAAGMAAIEHTRHDLDRHHALEAEIASFVDCVTHGTAPRVSGEDGLAALELATRITELIHTAPAAGASS